MTYQSIDLPAHIIDDSNAQSEINIATDEFGEPGVFGTGLIERDYDAEPRYGKLPVPLIPEDEWEDRIEQREKLNLTNRALRNYAKIPTMNQGRLPYCWCFGPVQAVHYLQVRSGMDLVPLSPASVGAPITGFRKVGGWGKKSVKQIVDHGACEASKWPATAVEKRFDTEQNRRNAARYKITEWFDLTPQNFPEIVTSLLMGWPVSVAFNWWGHLVVAVDAVIERGEVCLLIHNSWGNNWGTSGMGVIKGRKKYPNEQIAIRQVTQVE